MNFEKMPLHELWKNCEKEVPGALTEWKKRYNAPFPDIGEVIALPVDIYSCEECGNAFCVEKDTDPKMTPCCESELFEYSHTGKVVMTNE